jgi:hypothetical protein
MAKKMSTIKAAQFFTMTCDEVTTIDNGTWIYVHLYVVQDFSRFHMLAALEHVEDGATSNNLTKVIMAAVQAVSRLKLEEIAKKMVCFEASNLLVKLCDHF